MVIIAFGHRKYTGKDTAARFVCTEYKMKNMLVSRKGFADKLKDIAHQLYWWAGVEPKEYYEDNPKRKETFIPALNKTVRQIWIDIGLAFRQVYEDTWVDLVLNTHVDLLLITDLKFPNEYKKIKERGGYCIRIDRWSVTPTNDEADIALANFNDWDFIIENNDDMYKFHENIMSVVRPLIGDKL